MFYPDNPTSLRQMIETFFGQAADGGEALGVVSPHAGYIYSGQTAAHAISTLPADFDGTIVLIGPSHQGMITCASDEVWETPLGAVQTDSLFIDAMDITVDEFSHKGEHSLEVQVPFLQIRFPGALIAPVMMGSQSLSSVEHLAEKIIRAIRTTGRNIRIVASSDFSHYIPEDVARRQDLYAIEALKNLDVGEFFRRIHDEGVSACGYGPIATMVTVCRSLGATRGKLIRYTTSAEASGDYSQVVGYAAIAVI